MHKKIIQPYQNIIICNFLSSAVHSYCYVEDVQNFLPFGGVQGDTVQDTGDDVAFEIPPIDTSITFFGTVFVQEPLYVSLYERGLAMEYTYHLSSLPLIIHEGRGSRPCDCVLRVVCGLNISEDRAS